MAVVFTDWTGWSGGALFVSKAAPKRFQRKNWLELSFKIIRSDPSLRLTIDLLCKQANKTRGSFYFHFKNMEAYFNALAEHWFEEFTLELIRRSEQRATPAEKLDHLNTLAFQLDPRIEQGMRALATREKCIRNICTIVDKKRLEYLVKLYLDSGKYSNDDATALATIEYAAMVGFQQIRPDASPKGAALMYQSFLKFTGRA